MSQYSEQAAEEIQPFTWVGTKNIEYMQKYEIQWWISS